MLKPNLNAGVVFSALKVWLLPAVLILAAQGAVLRVLSIPEKGIVVPRLDRMPGEFGGWKTVSEDALDPAVQEYLKPDSYILRNYGNAASIFRRCSAVTWRRPSTFATPAAGLVATGC